MKKKFTILGLSVLATLGLASCSTEFKQAQNNLNNSILTVLKTNDIAKEQIPSSVDNYVFLGANVGATKTKNYDVSISGISQTTNGEKAYTTLNYEINPMTYVQIDNSSIFSKDFNNYGKNQNETNMLNELANVVKNCKPLSCEYAKVANIAQLNTAVKNITQSPLKDFRMSKNLLYSVSGIDYNYENNYVSFNTCENTKFYKTETKLVWTLLGVDAEGNTKYGWTTKDETTYESFVQEYKIYVKANKDELDQMKEDTSLIFNKFIDAVKNNDKSLYTAQSLDVRENWVYDTNMMDYTNVNEL